MSQIIHIFFNGSDCRFAENNDWEKFQGVDTLRTFAICAESWRRAGWQVNRLSTVTLRPQYQFTPFLPDGECSKSFGWYPADYWQFIAAAKEIAFRDPLRGHFFGTMDVLNFGFEPLTPFRSEAPRCVNYQADHFSLSFVQANFAWLVDAEKILLAYDQGKIPPLRRDYTSDETILRNYAPDVVNHPVQRFAAQSHTAELLHFSRSSLRQYIDGIPFSLT